MRSDQQRDKRGINQIKPDRRNASLYIALVLVLLLLHLPIYPFTLIQVKTPA